MAKLSGDRAGWSRSVLMTLVALPLIGLAAAAQQPAADSKAKAADQPKGKAAKKAARLLAAAADASPTMKPDEATEKAKAAADAIRELGVAVRAEERTRGIASAAKLANRPARAVVPPTIDPAGVDALVDKALAATKTAVSPGTTDEEFVRRVYLDVVGRLPTIEQMRAFVLSREKGKRARLIDHLLTTEDYAANWARYWRDVVAFRAPNENGNQPNFPAFEAWLAAEFRKNAPWDSIAAAMITAEGPTTENGAVSFGLAQMAQPVELAGEVSRVFMGVQIQCAQCHDHPSDKWKREQFHEFASFFAGIGSRRSNPNEKMGRPIFEVFTRPAARYTMPDLKDPTRQTPVEPRFFLGESAPKLAALKPDQRRALAASYVTGQDNPWFARAFVNRVWGVLMGEGFYNPVDDLGPTKEAHDPEVLDAIALQWQRGGYDVRWLFRTILNTKAYQRESRSSNSAAGRTPFAANCPGRLRADQIFDNLAQALDIPAETFPGRNKAQAAKMQQAFRDAVAKKVGDMPQAFQQVALNFAQQRNAPRSKFDRTFGFDPSTPVDDVLGTIPQALYLMNSPGVNSGIKAGPSTMLGELLRTTPDNRAVLDVLYLRVLARRPNGKEVAVCGHYLDNVGNRVEAFEDILWSLINSTEFVSRR